MKVIKEGSEKLGLLKIDDDSFACNSPLGIIFDEFNQLSEMDDDLFTYEVEILGLPTIPCDEKERDNSNDGDLCVYKPRVCYDENDGIYAEAVIFVNKRLVSLMDVTVEQWLDLMYGDHMKVDIKIKEGVVSKWFPMKRGQKMEFLLMTSIIFASLSVSRMGKLNVPLAIQMRKDSAMEENYRGCRWEIKEEALKQKAIYEMSWGDATQGVMNVCAWLKRCFGNFHELNYKLLVTLEEYWWKMNDHKCSPFTNWRIHIQETYANTNLNAKYNPYIDVSRMFNNHERRNDEEVIQEEKGAE
ncbi:hypothetical protein Tco_0971078 [Tanacetum coccineum]